MRILPSLLAISALTAAEPVMLDNFNHGNLEFTSEQSSDRVTELALVSAPLGLGSGKALSLGWAARNGGWIESNYAWEAKREIAGFGSEGAQVSLALWADAFTPINYIGLRLVDGEGEVYQWRAELPNPERTGWRPLLFTASPSTASGHWGPFKDGLETGNGKIDLPVSVLGFAIAFKDAKVPAGQVFVDDIKARPLAQAQGK